MIETLPDGCRARCDQCAAISALLPTPNANAAESLLGAVGWSFDLRGQLAFCHRCGTSPATPSSRRRIATLRAPGS